MTLWLGNEKARSLLYSQMVYNLRFFHDALTHIKQDDLPQQTHFLTDVDVDTLGKFVLIGILKMSLPYCINTYAMNRIRGVK